MKKFVPIGVAAAGKEVVEICKQLALAGSKIKPVKNYTIGVYSAVKAFQKKNGLSATGVVDKKTWDKLMAVKPVPKRGKK